MERIVKLIDDNQDKINHIIVSLDTHQAMHIAHPLFWLDADGNHPNPFTIIKRGDVPTKWKVSRPEFTAWADHYLQSLEEDARFELCIWPPHCLIGSAGHGVVPKLLESLHRWASARHRAIDYVRVLFLLFLLLFWGVLVIFTKAILQLYTFSSHRILKATTC